VVHYLVYAVICLQCKISFVLNLVICKYLITEAAVVKKF